MPLISTQSKWILPLRCCHDRVQFPSCMFAIRRLHTSASSFSSSFWRHRVTAVNRFIHMWMGSGCVLEQWRSHRQTYSTHMPCCGCMRGVGTEETGEKQEGFPLRHFFHPEAGVPILAFSSFLSCCREQRLDDSEIHPEPWKVFVSD